MASTCLQLEYPTKLAACTPLRSAKAASPRRYTNQELAIGQSGSRCVLRDFLKNRDSRLLQLGSPSIMCRLSLRDIWRKCLDTPADDEVWLQLLDRIYPVLLRIARNVAHHSGLDRPEDVDDLVQEICIKISHPANLRSIRLPSDDKQAELYFHATAANAARDALRARFASKRGENLTFSMEEHLAELSDFIAVPAIEREILFRQIDELLKASTSERTIFWLYFRQGLTSKEISAIPAIGLTSKGVESALQRMTASLRSRLKTTTARAEDRSSGAD